MKSTLTRLIENFGNPFKAQKYFPFNFKLPECYKDPFKATPEILKNFKETTLFYIFYNVIDQAAQKIAALKLCERGWLYDPATLTWYTSITEKGQSKLMYFEIKGWKIELVAHQYDKTGWIGTKEFYSA